LVGWPLLAADRRVASLVGGRDADPRQDARFWNLVEGVSTSAGVRQPLLRVVDSPALNILVSGSRTDRGLIVATTGLLAELSRIEMEGVVAEQLAQLRHGETRPATLLAATFGLGRRWALTSDRDARADQLALSITRYPPALASALEKMDTKGTAVAGPSYLSHLWLADPCDPPDSQRLPLRDRIEALREL
jgi:heat shock protein HtpX